MIPCSNQGILTEGEFTNDLLINVSCFVKKVNNILIIKTSWSKLVRTRRLTVLILSIQKWFLAQSFKVWWLHQNLMPLSLSLSHSLLTFSVKKNSFHVCHWWHFSHFLCFFQKLWFWSKGSADSVVVKSSRVHFINEVSGMAGTNVIKLFTSLIYKRSQ